MDYITLAHGAGGKKSHDLIKDVFIKHLGNDLLAKVDDAALIGLESDKIAFTTDSYVIKPCFFREVISERSPFAVRLMTWRFAARGLYI